MTSRRPPAVALQRSLIWSVADGTLHALMLGVSESYLGAFAVELGHQDTALALLSTVPPLCGALSQLCAPFFSTFLGSRKRLVILGILLQALSHLLFVAIAVNENQNLWFLLGAKVAFWTSGLVIVPPWNAWIGALTEDISRSRYFLWRTTACHLALLMSFLWSGTFLQDHRATDIHAGFAWLFLLGLLARSLGAYAVSHQVDPVGPESNRAALTIRLRQAMTSGPWKVAFAIGLLQFGAHVAVPFFTPYMLRTLHLELDAYALLTSVTIVGKALSLPLWGILAGRVGLGVAMALAVATIAIVPAVWVWASTFPELVLVQILGGLGWAGFEYVSLQLLLGSVPKRGAVEFFSLSNSLAGAFQLAGSMTGSALLGSGADYHTVFLASSVLRAIPLLLLVPTAAVVGRGLPLRKLWLRLVSVRPGAGVVRRPVIPVFSDDDDRDERDSYAPDSTHADHRSPS